MDVIERQTRLAELLSSMLLEGIIFPEAGEVMKIAEEMKKEKVEFGRMSGEMKRAVLDYQTSIHKLNRSGEIAGVEEKRREVSKSEFEKMVEEKKKVEERLQRVEEEKKRVEAENRALQARIQRLTEEKMNPEEENKQSFPSQNTSTAQSEVSVSPPRKEKVQLPRSAAIQLRPPIISLSSLSLSFSDPVNMKRKNNMIIYQGDKEGESCLIGDVLRNVSLLFFFFSLCISISSHPGNLSNVSLYCSVSPFLSLSFPAPSRYILFHTTVT